MKATPIRRLILPPAAAYEQCADVAGSALQPFFLYEEGEQEVHNKPARL